MPAIFHSVIMVDANFPFLSTLGKAENQTLERVGNLKFHCGMTFVKLQPFTLKHSCVITFLYLELHDD